MSEPIEITREQIQVGDTIRIERTGVVEAQNCGNVKFFGSSVLSIPTPGVTAPIVRIFLLDCPTKGRLLTLDDMQTIPIGSRLRVVLLERRSEEIKGKLTIRREDTSGFIFWLESHVLGFLWPRIESVHLLEETS